MTINLTYTVAAYDKVHTSLQIHRLVYGEFFQKSFNLLDDFARYLGNPNVFNIQKTNLCSKTTYRNVNTHLSKALGWICSPRGQAMPQGRGVCMRLKKIKLPMSKKQKEARGQNNNDLKIIRIIRKLQHHRAPAEVNGLNRNFQGTKYQMKTCYLNAELWPDALV